MKPTKPLDNIASDKSFPSGGFHVRAVPVDYVPSRRDRKTAAMSYSCRALWRAITCLVLGTRGIRERLFLEAAPGLNSLNAKAFPAGCREEIEWIQGMLNRYPAEPDSTSIQVNYNRRRASTATRIAERVWGLYLRLNQLGLQP